MVTLCLDFRVYCLACLLDFWVRVIFSSWG